MYFSIRHLTSFYYSHPITESVMALYMKPRNDHGQSCLRFQIVISPNAKLSDFQDFLGNTVHLFDIPGRHTRLAITSESIVETQQPAALPQALPVSAWDKIDDNATIREHFEMLQPSRFTEHTPLLSEFAEEIDATRRADPLTLLHELNTRIYEYFDYVQETTTVDSMIDEILQTRQGVCQDFVHVMLALLRRIGIPSRYVSGYLFHRESGYDRSAVDATHAWIEAWLPGLGWIGFDPTNNTPATERHIRVAVGRDYDDVPPTRGVFKGEAITDLKVSVHVTRLESAPETEQKLVSPVDWSLGIQQQQMQQQQ